MADDDDLPGNQLNYQAGDGGLAPPPEDAHEAAQVAAVMLQDLLEARRQAEEMMDRVTRRLDEANQAQQELADQHQRLAQERAQWDDDRRQAAQAHGQPPPPLQRMPPPPQLQAAAPMLPQLGGMPNGAPLPQPAAAHQVGAGPQHPAANANVGPPPQHPQPGHGARPGQQAGVNAPVPEDPILALARQLAAAQLNAGQQNRPTVISQMTLEPFSGKESEDWLGWKERVTSLFEDEGTPDHRRHNRFHLYLRGGGGALNYWRSLGRREHMTWAEILASFDQRYANPDNADYHEREFYARTYKGDATEGPHDFLQELTQRAELAFPDHNDPMGRVVDNRTRERASQVKKQFIQGMPPKIRNVLFMKNRQNTPAIELADWARKKFLANKLSGSEDQLSESFNVLKAKTDKTKAPPATAAEIVALVQNLDQRYTRRDQGRPAGPPPAGQYSQQQRRPAPREFTPTPGYMPPPPAWGGYYMPPPMMPPPQMFQGQPPYAHPPAGAGQGPRPRPPNNGQGQGQGNNQGGGGNGQGKGKGRGQGGGRKSICYRCGSPDHVVSMCPHIEMPLNKPVKGDQDAQPPKAAAAPQEQQAPQAKAKQSTLPVARAPGKQSIQELQVTAEEPAPDYENWYAEYYDQVAAAQDEAMAAEDAQVAAVHAGTDIDTTDDDESDN